VRDGIATLRGQVRSPEQRTLALDLAAACDGVIVVEDRIRGPGGN
jgi:osmotically-inducible protein OsmY